MLAIIDRRLGFRSSWTPLRLRRDGAKEGDRPQLHWPCTKAADPPPWRVIFAPFLVPLFIPHAFAGVPLNTTHSNGKYARPLTTAAGVDAGVCVGGGPHTFTLDDAQAREVDRVCALVRKIGERIIVPLLRSVEDEGHGEEEDESNNDHDHHEDGESWQHGRTLVHLDRRFKDPEQVKRKIGHLLLRQQPTTATAITTTTARSRTPTKTELASALSAMPDTLRFTLQYHHDASYATGVRKDIQRLQKRGLRPVMLRNAWGAEQDQYRGVNVRWREPSSGLLFEVQFHTRASLAARERTHGAYERIRAKSGSDPAVIDSAEIVALRAFQREVNATVPIPAGAVDISWAELRG